MSYGPHFYGQQSHLSQMTWFESKLMKIVRVFTIGVGHNLFDNDLLNQLGEETESRHWKGVL